MGKACNGNAVTGRGALLRSLQAPHLTEELHARHWFLFTYFRLDCVHVPQVRVSSDLHIFHSPLAVCHCHQNYNHGKLSAASSSLAARWEVGFQHNHGGLMDVYSTTSHFATSHVC